MKAHFITFILGLAATMAFTGCSNDDDVPAASIPLQVSDSFRQMYPNAQSVDWERELQYYVADFYHKTFETEAWFQPNGSWAMTETDYGSLVSMLPIEVESTFNASQYADWIVDDAKYYDRGANSFCIIEVETDGMPEIALFYDSFGNLVNKVQGDDFDITPTTVITDITF